ncbi:hypothetical protein BKA69DRAFT_1129032 [Paraphysoderma sedebokerense]|nr:hypothetical protein BKA69DRAFT_1129032 [Paraphysoderma sedebokerense]
MKIQDLLAGNGSSSTVPETVENSQNLTKKAEREQLIPGNTQMAYLPLTHSKPDSSRSHTLPTPAITYSSTRSSSPPPKRVKPSNPIHQDFSNHPTTSLYGSRSSSGITRSYTPTGQSKIASTVSRSSSHLVRELDFRQNTREHQSPIDVQAHSILESYKARPETVSELMNILNVDGRRVPTLQILLETGELINDKQLFCIISELTSLSTPELPLNLLQQTYLYIKQLTAFDTENSSSHHVGTVVDI